MNYMNIFEGSSADFKSSKLVKTARFNLVIASFRLWLETATYYVC